ncbi:hypothetical protein AAC387_Pa05g1584 [Persea americana]
MLSITFGMVLLLPSDIMHQLFPCSAPTSIRFGRRNPAEEYDGEEKDTRGEEERPKVGDNGHKAWSIVDEKHKENGEKGRHNEVKSVLQERFWDVHGHEQEGEIKMGLLGQGI